MPTLIYQLTDLQKLIGKKVTIPELEQLLHFAKAELEDYNKNTDEIKIEFTDTNLPYLWSVEGLSLLLRRVLGKDEGIPKLKIAKGKYSVRVDPSVKKIRPYLSSFVAKGNIDESLLLQLIQLQEKLSDNYGRKREKLAIGIYPYDKINFPITYKAVLPESTRFVPLGYQKEMTLKRILKEHPKGIEYADTLKDAVRYPILVDSKGQILSMIPIINSEHLGKVEEGSAHLFFEASGTDADVVHLATNIFAQALHERKFQIHSVDVKYPKKITTPMMFNEKVKLNVDLIDSMLGLQLKKPEIRKLLMRMGYDVKGDYVFVPHYRRDILHPADIIEDVAISYGYDKIEPAPLEKFTLGGTLLILRLIDSLRDLFVGAGYQESYSQVLSSKNIIHQKMNVKNTGVVEIQDYMTETYSAVRSWLLPVLIDLLSKNKHVEYPHRVFEQGLVSKRKGTEIVDQEKIAAVTAHEKADFTEIKQTLNTVMRNLGLSYKLEETVHPSFIPGRVGKIFVKNKEIGFVGEIAPQVLENFGLVVPVAALEFDVTQLFELSKK